MMGDIGRVTWAWLRIDARRRWRSLTVLALLIAIATATVLTAVAGARRGATVVERLTSRSLPADATVLPNEPGFDWDTVRALPEVEALSGFVVAYYLVDELPQYYGYLPPADAAAMHTIERPVVLEGRLADPNRVDEVVVTPRFPTSFGKGVGDTVTLHLQSPQQAGDPDAQPPAQGPRIHARIVGVVRSPWFSDQLGQPGAMIPSPALFQTYPDNFLGNPEVYGVVNALVRLRGGEAALPAFRRDLTNLTGRSDIEIWNNGDIARHAEKVTGFEASCLIAFGVAALVAALVLIGQALSRYTASATADLRVLQAIGLRRRQGAAAAATGPALAGLAGAWLGMVAAVVASRWMPIGAASYLEPHPGIDVDWLILAAGGAAAVAVVAATCAMSAWLSLAGGADDTSARRSPLAAAVARAGLPVPLVVGTRFALERGRGRSAVPVRPAIVGAVTGVLGVLAALTFSTGVRDAAANPERFGQTFQLWAYFGEHGHDFAPPNGVLNAFAQQKEVTAVNDARVAVATSGNTSITFYSYAPVQERPVRTVITSGRMPRTTDEVVLAPTTAKELGAGVGSMVQFRGSRPGTVTARVSGIGFVPDGSHNDYDTGGWLSAAGFDRMFDGFKYHEAMIAVRPGTDLQRLIEAVKAVPAAAGVPMEPAHDPDQVAEIRDVQTLPLVLGGFLGLLAVGAVGHALATAVRRRRVDVAVLRALGMTRWQARGLVVTQASVLALVGLVFGVPAGLALGRTLWRLVADYAPLQYVPPVAFWALLLVGPLALLAANMLAAWPGQQAARLRISHVLRAE